MHAQFARRIKQKLTGFIALWKEHKMAANSK